MSKGYVYILTNPALREVDAVVNGRKTKVEPVKIGMTNESAGVKFNENDMVVSVPIVD